MSVGRQLGELNVFSESELDRILLGIRDSVANAEPKADLNKYSPLAGALFQEKQMAKAAEAEAAGKAYLETAAAAPGAVKTATGLVLLSTTEGTGKTPSASDTVKV